MRRRGSITGAVKTAAIGSRRNQFELAANAEAEPPLFAISQPLVSGIRIDSNPDSGQPPPATESVLLSRIVPIESFLYPNAASRSRASARTTVCRSEILDAICRHEAHLKASAQYSGDPIKRLDCHVLSPPLDARDGLLLCLERLGELALAHFSRFASLGDFHATRSSMSASS